MDGDLERPPADGLDPDRPVAFLCAEYGVHVSLPVYSGGLGALAGDLLKEASDRAIPMVAVGLMYRKGYFRQWIDASGWQHEYWIDTDPAAPAGRARDPRGRKPADDRRPDLQPRVTAHIWRVEVGRVPLFLLDTDVSVNGPLERWITARLYDADPITRLAQYVLLGAGGIRALSRARDRARRDPPERGSRRARAARAGGSASRLATIRLGARSRPRAHRVHDAHAGRRRATTHIHRARSMTRSRRWPASSAIPESDVIALGRTDPERRSAAVRHDSGGAAA